jgi:hypothetical protein
MTFELMFVGLSYQWVPDFWFWNDYTQEWFVDLVTVGLNGMGELLDPERLK